MSKIFKGNDDLDIPQVLSIFLPGKCNLNCVYCFVNKEGDTTKKIEIEIIKKEINLFFEFPGRKKIITINGGEPLLEWSNLKKIFAYAIAEAKKRDLLLELSFSSNGTLLNPEIANFLRKNNISIKISIDGKKEIHDMQRPFKAEPGLSSFDKIMHNISDISKEGLRLHASLVFTPENVTDLFSNIKFLKNNGFETIDYYPEIYAIWNKQEIRDLKNELFKIKKYYIGLFKRSEEIFKISLIDSIVNHSKIGSRNVCGKIQADTSGNFYSCDKVFSLPTNKKEKYFLGNIKKGLNMGERVESLSEFRKEIKEISNLNCQSCDIKEYCFCPIGQHIYLKNKKKYPLNFWKSYCDVTKALIKTHLDIIKILEFNKMFVDKYRF